MKYLDERITVKVTFKSAVAADGLAQYTVTLMDDVVFVGNVFLASGQRSATIDITDIVRNTITPLTFAGDGDSAIGYAATDYQFVVTINGASGYSDFVAPAYRYPNANAGDMSLIYGDMNVCQGGVLRVGAVGDSAIRYGGLIPRYPKAVSDDVEMNYLFLGNEGDVAHFWYGEKIDNINQRWMRVRKTLSDVGVKSYAPYSGFISGGTNCIVFGKTIRFTATAASVTSLTLENFATGVTTTEPISGSGYSYSKTAVGVPQATSDGLALSRLTITTSDGDISFELAAASAALMSEAWSVSIITMAGVMNILVTLTGNANGLIDDMRLYGDDRYTLGYVAEFAGIECGGDIVKKAARDFLTAYTPNASHPCWALWMVSDGERIDLTEDDGIFTAKPNTTSDVVYVAYKDADNAFRLGWFKIGYTDDEGVAVDLAMLSSVEVSVSGAVGSVIADASACTDNSILIGRAVCPKGYFLLWQDRLGSGQCQPFEMVNTYSEEVTGSEITNYYGKRSLYKVEVRPKWKLNSGWLTDDEYRAYESLFVSPWVKLYNADENACYEVILKDRAYTEKTFENQSRRLFNLSVEVEQVEAQGILY